MSDLCPWFRIQFKILSLNYSFWKILSWIPSLLNIQNKVRAIIVRTCSFFSALHVYDSIIKWWFLEFSSLVWQIIHNHNILYCIGLLNSYLHSDCKRGWVIPKWKIVLRLISMLHIYHGFYYFGFRRIDLNDLLATRTFCHHLITHFLVEILANLRGSLSFLL